MTSFTLEPMPKLLVGSGRVAEAAKLASAHGRRVLLVTGERSFANASALVDALDQGAFKVQRVVIDQEPTPAMVDAAVANHPDAEVVIAVGGGAVVDAGKAISAMLPIAEPVKDYLEGVGDKVSSGLKRPFIACPTTAGTGAEATKNAVLSEVGSDGFKKSLRHDRFVPDAVILDPDLMVGCPPDITAACGMDALTQLLEAFVSPQASAATDALARSGLRAVADSLLHVCGDGHNDLSARQNMGWGAFCSGVCLAHAGLGIVHGFASPIGGFYPIPHGVVCGTLLPAATSVNVHKMLADPTTHARALSKHAEVGRLLSGDTDTDDPTACHRLIETLQEWKRHLAIAPLSDYGIGVEDRILDGTGLKNNPVQLDRAALSQILIESGAVS
jgi:alcohol dehydrogenase